MAQKPKTVVKVVSKLLLNKEHNGLCNYILPLTEEQYNLVQFAFKHKDSPNFVKRMFLSVSLLLNETQQEITGIFINDELIYFDSIELIGEAKWSNSILKYCKPKKKINDVEYYYDYENDWYDFYATGIEETGRFWIHILRKIGSPDYAMIITE